MVRLLTILTLTFVVIAAVLMFQNGKDLYKLLPVNEGPSFEEANFQDWHEFQDPNKRFQVLVPQLPQHAGKKKKDELSGEERSYEMYSMESEDGTLFTILMITFPEPLGVTEVEAQLKEAQDKLLKANPNNQLVMRSTSNFRGHDALDLGIENEEYQILAKAFVVDDTLFVISSIAKNANFNQNEFDFFVNSFSLKENPIIPDIPSTPFIEKKGEQQ